MAYAKVLVIEDEDDIRNGLAEFLVLEGFDVTTAKNGREGIEKVKRDKPGLVFLDLMMPVMSGWEYLLACKEDRELASVPVVVVSAVPKKIKAENVIEILRKPVDIDEILETAQQHCRIIH